MIPELLRPRLDRYARAQAAAALSAGPWLWPHAGEPLARAHAIVPGGPPAPLPGEVPLLAVSETTTSLWVLHPRRTGTKGGWVPFGQEARRTWLHAVAVLPRSLPVLWKPVQELDSLLLQAQWLTSLAEPGNLEGRESVLDGPSFGLSMLIALASLLFERPLAEDLAASAAIEPDGSVRAVGGLTRKGRLLVERAPRVRRLLVPAEQAPALRAELGARLAVVGVSTCAEALGEAFGSELSGMVLAAGADAQQRRELAASFFRLALAGRGATVDWTPVAEAARLAHEGWGELGEAERHQLRFVMAVAARHEGRAAPAGLPDTRWLASLPAPTRLEVLAHAVQQSADAGAPEPDQVAALARAHLLRGREAFVQHLRLLGALGRLLAFTGELREALRTQQEAAEGFVERMSLQDLTYPLSECYRLAGVLGDERALEWADGAAFRGGCWGGREPYTGLARARALVMLAKPEESAPVLRKLCDSHAVPSHVRWSAARWLLRAEPDSATAVAAERAMAEALGAPRGAGVAKRYSLLVALDRALARGTAQQAEDALGGLHGLEPGLVGNLVRGGPAGEAPGAWVARAYPY